MKRIVLNEQNLLDLVSNGYIVVDEVTIDMAHLKLSGGLSAMCKGKIHQQENVQMILQDIGYDRINSILNKQF